MRRYKIVEFLLYLILTTIIFSILTFLPLNFTYYVSLFLVGFMMRVFLSKKQPKEHIQKLNRFSLAKIFYFIDKLIWGIKSQPLRYTFRLLIPYFLVFSITWILQSDAPTYLVLIGSISFDLSMLSLGKFEFEHQ